VRGSVAPVVSDASRHHAHIRPALVVVLTEFAPSLRTTVDPESGDRAYSAIARSAAVRPIPPCLILANKLLTMFSERDMAKTKSTGQRKIHKVMKEKKEGTLKSGSGKKVTSRKQAVAIALSEARKSGAKIPKKKS
jgi:hypothetical protein